MLWILGIAIVIVCTLGGYVADEGNLSVLWQPFEWVIIFGCALGGFVVASSKGLIIKTAKGTLHAFKGVKYSEKTYLELLVLMYTLFKMARTKGVLALESHIENPNESTLFAKFPFFNHHHEARTFFCDYLRLITMGTNSPHQLEDLMEQEIDTHHAEAHQVSFGMAQISDSMPAIGIVAAVLGIIHTMGSITEPPEILGHLIGGALVGTFSGVWLSYAYVGPMARSMEEVFDADIRYLMVIKSGLLAFMHGHAPQIAVEFARKSIFHDLRPDFYKLEEALGNAPTE